MTTKPLNRYRYFIFAQHISCNNLLYVNPNWLIQVLPAARLCVGIKKASDSCDTNEEQQGLVRLLGGMNGMDFKSQVDRVFF